MTKTKIEWCDYTWNPVTGCLHGCPYCYARRIALRFQGHFRPAFHPERLEEPGRIKKPSKIFVTSMGDLFGEWVPREWIIQVLKVVHENPQHEFYFLTKHPLKYKGIIFPKNAWIGITLTGERPGGGEKASLEIFGVIRHDKKFISFEPLLGPWVPSLHHCKMEGLQKVFIGGLSGPGARPAYPMAMDFLVKQCKDEGIECLKKKNAYLKPKKGGVSF